MLKIRFFVFFSVFFLLFFNATYSYIVESDQLQEIARYIGNIPDKQGFLIIFDLDNTLIETTEILGSDQWFYYEVEQYKIKGVAVDQAIPYLLPLYYKIRKIVDISLTEPQAPSFIHSLQKQSMMVIGLTTQGFHLAHRTTSQLKNFDIDFSASAFFGDYIEKNYECTHGIIFCNGYSKKKILEAVFKQNSHYKPHTIICVDDKQVHLTAVRDFAYEHGINFYGIRYSRLDQKVAQFDPREAEKELEQFYIENNIKPMNIPYCLVDTCLD